MFLASCATTAYEANIVSIKVFESYVRRTTLGTCSLNLLPVSFPLWLPFLRKSFHFFWGTEKLEKKRSCSLTMAAPPSHSFDLRFCVLTLSFSSCMDFKDVQLRHLFDQLLRHHFPSYPEIAINPTLHGYTLWRGWRGGQGANNQLLIWWTSKTIGSSSLDRVVFSSLQLPGRCLGDFSGLGYVLLFAFCFFLFL